ncbi:MAG: hypothetical protein QNJ82_01070 [Gammaproteobacteria bacterium]|nr:hypothetical protein [Gammaproteobacteria bacterium]
MTEVWKRQVLIFLVFLALLGGTFVIYQPGLDGPLLLDDAHNLRPLKRLDEDPTLWREALGAHQAGPLGRPVSVLSFIGNWIMSGGDVRTFKYTNLMLHLLSGLLVFWLSGRLLRERTSHAWLAALWVAGLWLTAPLYVSTVLYVIQRMTQLAALFVFAGLLAYVIGRQNADRRPWLAMVLILSTALIWTPLAMFSKENGILLPLLAFLIEIVFFRFRGRQPMRWFLVSGFVIGLALPVLVGAFALSLTPEWLMDSYAKRPFSLTERLLTEARVVVDYARNLIAPQHTALGVYHDDYPVSQVLWTPSSTALSIAILGSLILLALWNVRRKPVDVLAFGMLFFFAGHLLESTVLPLELYFEHRNYLPGFGVFFLLTVGVLLLWERFPKARAGLLIAALVLPGILMASTHNKVKVWESEAALLTYAANFHPNSARAQSHIALYYARHRQVEKALQFADRAQELAGGSAASTLLLQFVLYCLADDTPPDGMFSALESDPLVTSDEAAAENLSVLTEMVLDGTCPNVDAQRLAYALDSWLKHGSEIQEEPTRWKMYAYTAKIAGHLGQYELALGYVDRAARLAPHIIELPMMKVYYLIGQGDTEAAKEALVVLQGRRVRRGQTAHVLRITEYYRDMLDSMASNAERP